MCEKSVVLCTSTGAESVNVEESAFLLFSLRAKIIVSVKKKRQARQTRRFTEQVAWLLEVEVWDGGPEAEAPAGPNLESLPGCFGATTPKDPCMLQR